MPPSLAPPVDEPVSDACSDAAAQILPHRVDSYGSVVVDALLLPNSPSLFVAALQASLTAWRNEGRRAVWLSVPLHQSCLIPLAVASGFAFHHAEKSHLMLTSWLLVGEPCTLPSNASHSVGVAAFVVNARGEVLVVQEIRGPFARYGHWKLPTGSVNQGEPLHVAAVREVMEETRMLSLFAGVLGFRQEHNMLFGKDDLLFLCAMRLCEHPVPADPVAAEGEIAAARWMPVSQFAELAHAGEDTVWGHFHSLCMRWLLKEQVLLTSRQCKGGNRPGLVYRVT